jgi:hypothetical protein
MRSMQKIMQQSKLGHPIPLANALRQYYGRSGPLSFKNASAGFYKGFEDIESCISDVFEIVTGTPGMIYQVNTLGGAIQNRNFESQSCFPHRALPYLSELQTYWETPNPPKGLLANFDKVQSIFYEHGIRAQYSNYCSREFTDWQQAYYGESYAALQRIKRRLDPENLFQHPQSIRPA